MTYSYKNAGRMTGFLLFIQIAAGIVINQVLLGPFTFSKDYLSSVAAHSLEVTVAMLLGILSGAVSIGIAAMLLPAFKKHSQIMAFAFLAFSVGDFAAVTVDNAAIQSLLALSKQYVKQGATSTGYFETAGSIAYATRLWTHLMTLLIPCLSASLFYYLLFKARLVPRFISVWGLIGTALMGTSILLMIFDKGSSMLLLIPLGLNQLFLCVWLLLKGLRSSDSTNGQGK